MPPPYGSFSPLCSSPSTLSDQADVQISTAAPLPHCNLFFRSLLKVTSPPALTTLFPFRDVTGASRPLGPIKGETSVEDLVATRAVGRAGTGVGIRCDVGRMGQEGSLGDIAQLITSVICFLIVLALIFRTIRRRAAVGRVEILYLFSLFALTLPLRILTTANVLQQGSAALVVLSAIHVALNVGMMWILLANAVVATQVVPDGTPSSMIPMTLIFLVFFGITTYIALDQAFGISGLFKLTSGRAEVAQLRNVALWTLGVLWPYLASVIYLIIMLYVVYYRLQETRPCIWLLLSFLLFAGSQVVLFLASQPLCEASNGKLTSGFLNTLLETAAVATLFAAWSSITEAEWDEPIYMEEYPGYKY